MVKLAMWLTLDEIIHTGDLYIPRENLLFSKCGKCHRRIVWRNRAGFASLNASCCGFCYDAIPTNLRGDIFKILMQEADMSNVIVLSAEG